MSADRVARIQALLEDAFAPLELEIIDESHLHAGHAGAQDGRGHFAVRIVSSAFRDTRPVERHRMVYSALGDMMRTDIHALRVNATPP